MTGTSASSVGAASPLDLRSFPQAGVAVVFGASGGIGGALLAAIRAEQSFDHVVAFSRSTSPSIDLLDEASLERAASFAAEKGELRLVRRCCMDRRGIVNLSVRRAEGRRFFSEVRSGRSACLGDLAPNPEGALARSAGQSAVTVSG